MDLNTLHPSEQVQLLNLKGTIIESRWKQYRFYFLLLFLSLLVVVLTIFFTFVSSSSKPIIIFLKPETIIFALSAGSTISVFLLNELVVGIYDCLRWTLTANKLDVAF